MTMMRDRSWRIGDREFWLRAWWTSPRWLLWSAWYAVLHWWNGPREHIFDESPFWTRTLTGDNAECYCPEGITTEFRFRLLDFGFWFEVRRGGPKRPCPCDKMLWLLFPEHHTDEIDDYGLARLQAEFPGVGP